MRSTFYKVTGRLSRQYEIALVVDTHNAPCDGILEELKAKNPDIIILAGDIVYGAEIDRSTFSYNPRRLWVSDR